MFGFKTEITELLFFRKVRVSGELYPLFNTEHSVFESKVVDFFCFFAFFFTFSILFFGMMDFLLEMRTEVFAEVMVRYTDLLPNHPVAEVGRSGWIKLGCVSNCLRKGDVCMRFY